MGIDMILVIALAAIFFGGVGILIWKDREKKQQGKTGVSAHKTGRSRGKEALS